MASHTIKMGVLFNRLLIFACFFVAIHGNTRFNYFVTEEQRAGTFIGNIATNSQLKANLTIEEFNSLRFSLLPQRNPHYRLFRVDKNTGVLTTTAKLDRENICGQASVCRVNMSVAAFSTISDFVSVFNISVLISDINDNSPVFPNANMKVMFSESAKVGDSFQIQQAVDHDSGVNGEIRYELQGSDGTFDIKYDITPEGKVTNLRIVVNRLLDRERSQQQQMTLVARDGGSPTKIATATITISVSDVNDHSPVFTDNIYKLQVLESTPTKTLLLQVTANDMDIGINGQVTYQLPTLTPQNTKDIFFLNSSTGDLILQEPLDFESVQLYEFQVEARDGGSPHRATQATIKVNVLDVNDNTPAITFNLPPGRQMITVPESRLPGDFITEMSVFDGDSGRDGEVVCQMAGNRFKLLHVFGSEFKILLNSSLDRESEPIVNMTVTCADRGSPPKQDFAKLTLQIEDVNDNAPVFTEPSYTVEVLENPENGDVILTTTASDKDVGENGRVMYKINATGAQFFQVLSNGDVVVSSKLDREITPEVVFDIIATDSVAPFHSSTATVTVIVLDKNDESPDFGNSATEISVMENQPAGTFVTKLTAEDLDLGPGGQVNYRILEDTLPFAISPNNGTVTTTTTLDRETQEIYEFIVLAEDNGSPQQTGSVKVTLKVADENDNSPTFTFPNDNNNSAIIYNSLKVGKIVAAITAIDSDDKNNSKIEYIFKSPVSSFFILESESGIIRLAKSMRGLPTRTFEITIIAKDHGNPQLSTEKRLFVIAKFDNRPLPMLDGLSGRTNLTIAICILAFSLIVSGTIVIIICLVRRRNSKNTDEAVKVDHGQVPPTSEKTWNSLYDSKKTSSADIIISRDRTPQHLQPVPSQLDRDDRLLYKTRDPTNPTFQVFPAEDQHIPKMGYTEDMLVKSDGQSNSSTGDSGRGLSQDDIQWVHRPDFDNPHSMEEERFSQSSIPSHDTRSTDPMFHDFPWQNRHVMSHSAQPSPSSHLSHSVHMSRSAQPSPSSHHSRTGYNIHSNMGGSSYT